ncbi:MAG: hypothetical protein ABW040_04715 [Microbacteriaceae bacterium]
MTQARPPVPGYDGPAFRARRTRDESAQDDLPDTQAVPVSETPSYRVRDYSPEGRPAPSWAPQYTGAPAEGANLDYQTQARDQVPSASVPAAAAASAPAPSTPEPVAPAANEPAPVSSTPVTPAPVVGAERTMTRRELRALREAQEAAEAAAAAAAVAPAVAAPPVVPAAEAPAAEAPAAEPAAAETPDVQAPPIAGAPSRMPPPPPERTVAETPEPVVAEPVAAPETPASFGAPSADAPTSAAEPAVADVDQPVDLVEPPQEPKRDAASVFDALFTPPSERPASAAEPPADDPLAFLAPPAPAVEDRVDLPAPPVAGEQTAAEQAPAEQAPAELAQPGFAEPASAPEPVVDATPVEATPVDATPVDEPVVSSAPSFESAPPPSPFSASPFDLPAPQGAPVDLEQPASAPDAAPVSASEAEQTAASEPTVIAEIVDETPPEVAAWASAPAPVVPAEPLPGDPAVVPPVDLVRPTGHWTTQTGDETDPHGMARNVLGGHGVVTTNALVLPNIPQPDFATSLTNTGEIMVTGSIDLPHSMASTGAHPAQLDGSALDHELDAGDHQVASVDSAPVRAIRAVSTHTSTRGVIANVKPKGNRGFTVLIVVASIMVVAVGGLLVYGLVTGVLG